MIKRSNTQGRYAGLFTRKTRQFGTGGKEHRVGIHEGEVARHRLDSVGKRGNQTHLRDKN